MHYANHIYQPVYAICCTQVTLDGMFTDTVKLSQKM